MICVFDKMTPQDKFHTCGIRILNPSTCYSQESLNGDHSLDMTYQITAADDAWKFLVEWNIIKTSSGQLYVIYYSQFNQNTVTIKARDIFYYLNDKIVYNAEQENFNCFYAISEVIGKTNFRHEDGQADYTFTFNSDISDVYNNISYNGVSTTYALMGSPESVLNLYGGELFRNNFYFSINHRREGSRDNAFNIIHGVNMIDIKETVDITDVATEAKGIDNYGNEFAISWVPNAMFPHHITKYLKFSYNGESRLEADVTAYFDEHKFPKVSYEVNFNDLKGTNKYADWVALESYNIGDVGTIYSGKLGMNTTQKIISNKVNELTGKTESITLGNFRPSIFVGDRFQRIRATDDSSGRRLDRLESLINIPESQPEEGE